MKISQPQFVRVNGFWLNLAAVVTVKPIDRLGETELVLFLANGSTETVRSDEAAMLLKLLGAAESEIAQ